MKALSFLVSKPKKKKTGDRLPKIKYDHDKRFNYFIFNQAYIESDSRSYMIHKDRSEENLLLNTNQKER